MALNFTKTIITPAAFHRPPLLNCVIQSDEAADCVTTAFWEISCSQSGIVSGLRPISRTNRVSRPTLWKPAAKMGREPSPPTLASIMQSPLSVFLYTFLFAPFLVQLRLTFYVTARTACTSVQPLHIIAIIIMEEFKVEKL